MSTDEKPKTIDQLYNRQSSGASAVEAPSWHYDALRQTAQRYELGLERPVDRKVALSYFPTNRPNF